MKKIILITLTILGISLLLGCQEPKVENVADNKMAEATEKFMDEAQRQVGMPAITNFQERKLAKMIFELRDKEDLICHAYITSYTGELIYLGKCLGYGLPYSIQFTNPKKIVDARNLGFSKYQDAGELQVVPQVDPNGLFMPEGLSATWIMLLDDQGEPHPVYIEQEIIVSPFKLKQ